MDEKFEPIDSSQPSKPPSSGLTLVLPALSALKQKHGIKKSKHKSTLPPSHADGFGEAKKPPRPLKLKPLKEVLLKLISQIKKKDDYAFFLSPVDPSQVSGYSDIIKRQMDFGTMTTKVTKGRYRSLEDFTSDLRLVTGNAKLFNPPGSIYYTEADRIEAWSLDHIAKAAPTVIEYETDWNIEIERDFDDSADAHNTNIDEDDQRYHQPGTPMDVDESIPSTQGRPAATTGRRVTRGPYQKKSTNPNTISESIDPEGRLPGSRDGLGAFPPQSDLARLMLALKIKGKRYRTKRERLRIEKGGPPYRADGSLDYAELQDPFSVLSFFVPDALSQLHLTPLYPPKDLSDTSLHTLVNLHYLNARPPPELRATTTTTPPRGKRHHWNIARNAPVRAKPKDRDDEDAGSNSWKIPREAQTVDWGVLAVLEGTLREEMDKRGAGAQGATEEEKLFDTIRESVESDKVAIKDDTQGYWSLARAMDAARYLREITYGSVDGFAYARSLAEFVNSADYHHQSDDAKDTALGMPLAQWVEENILSPLTSGRHALLRDTIRLLASNPSLSHDIPSSDTALPHSAILEQLCLSLHTYPTAVKHLECLRHIETHQIDMKSLIRVPSELFGSEKVWAGREWKKRRVDRLKFEGTIDESETKDKESTEEEEGMLYEGADLLSHVLDYSAGVITEFDQRLRSGSSSYVNGDHSPQVDGTSRKRKYEEDDKEGVTPDEGNSNSADSAEERDDEDPILRDLRLNLLALAKRAPLDKIARLPVELVPEHIRHYVPTLEVGA